MRFLLGLITGVFLSTGVIAYADKISSPPPIQDPSVYHYLRQIYENFHRLEVVTTNPDGVRSGKKGDMLLLQTGGTNYIEINTDSTTEWRGVALSNTP